MTPGPIAGVAMNGSLISASAAASAGEGEEVELDLFLNSSSSTSSLPTTPPEYGINGTFLEASPTEVYFMQVRRRRSE